MTGQVQLLCRPQSACPALVHAASCHKPAEIDLGCRPGCGPTAMRMPGNTSRRAAQHAGMSEEPSGHEHSGAAELRTCLRSAEQPAAAGASRASPPHLLNATPAAQHSTRTDTDTLLTQVGDQLAAPAERLQRLEQQVQQLTWQLCRQHTGSVAGTFKPAPPNHATTAENASDTSAGSHQGEAWLVRAMDMVALLLAQQDGAAAQQSRVARLISMHGSQLQAAFLAYCQLSGALWPPVMQQPQWEAFCMDAGIADVSLGRGSSSRSHTMLSAAQAEQVFATLSHQPRCHTNTAQSAASADAAPIGTAPHLTLEAFVAALIWCAADLDTESVLAERVQLVMQQVLQHIPPSVLLAGAGAQSHMRNKAKCKQRAKQARSKCEQ